MRHLLQTRRCILHLMALHLLITFLCYTKTLCLKITGKVPYNIASEASYVYKSSLKMPRMVHFGELLKSITLRSNSVTTQVSFDRRQKLVENAKIVNLAFFWKTVLPDRSILIGQKMVENAKIEKLKWDILSDF